MLEFLTKLWGFICMLGFVGIFVLIVVIFYTLKEGLIPAAVFFAALFTVIVLFGWHEWLGDAFMMKFLLGIGTGLLGMFLYFIMKD